jgi:antagonist of KipI
VLPGPQSTLASLELDEVANAALERLVAQWASVRPNTGPGRDAVHIRAMRGREWDHFTAASQAAFFSDPAVVSSQSERMGYRLSGLMLERKTQVDMLSEAVAFGSVQVPQDGQPIVLMADRQSTGGYPRVAQVASVDLPKLAQMMPGETVRFQSLGLDEAQQLLLQRAGRLAALRAALRGPDLELDAAPDDENRKRSRHEPDRSQL